jgi:hypothetical protein
MRVVLYPGEKNLIKVYQKVDVLNLVFLHFLPGFRDTCHAVQPKLKA